MIKLTSTNGKIIYLNPKYIITIEDSATGGSCIEHTKGIHYFKETPEEVFNLLQRK